MMTIKQSRNKEHICLFSVVGIFRTQTCSHSLSLPRSCSTTEFNICTFTENWKLFLCFNVKLHSIQLQLNVQISSELQNLPDLQSIGAVAGAISNLHISHRHRQQRLDPGNIFCSIHNAKVIYFIPFHSICCDISFSFTL